MLKKLLENNPEPALIIAPHEINRSHLDFLQSTFKEAVFYSQVQEDPAGLPEGRVLIIDNIGMLSRLYHYSTISYIGGGFNKSGIHNTLEAAVYGKPVIFGPHYQKFAEATGLIAHRAAFNYTHETELIESVNALLSDPALLETSSRNAREFVDSRTGATVQILAWIRKTFV